MASILADLEKIATDLEDGVQTLTDTVKADVGVLLADIGAAFTGGQVPTPLPPPDPALMQSAGTDRHKALAAEIRHFTSKHKGAAPGTDAQKINWGNALALLMKILALFGVTTP